MQESIGLTSRQSRELPSIAWRTRTLTHTEPMLRDLACFDKMAPLFDPRLLARTNHSPPTLRMRRPPLPSNETRAVWDRASSGRWMRISLLSGMTSGLHSMCISNSVANMVCLDDGCPNTHITMLYVGLPQLIATASNVLLSMR
eukprot:1155343-Pelagomonas_calceolata.AAC.4